MSAISNQIRIQNTRIKALLRFAQILDANFPSGMFSYSFGLEPHILQGKIEDIKSLERFLKNIIVYQYANFEFPIVLNLYRYLKSERLHLVLKLERQISSMLSFGYSKAIKQIGENYLLQIQNLQFSRKISQEYITAAKSNKTLCGEITLLVVLAYDMGVSHKDFLALWSKKHLINIALSSLKISKIKPSEVQYTLFLLDDLLEKEIRNAKDKISNFNPVFDETAYKHRFLEPRLFTT
jgi:urease accessory protein